MSENFEFLTRELTIHPTIYAFADSNYPGVLKVGQTDRTVEVRRGEVNGTIKPVDTVTIEGTWSAVRADGSIFTDSEVHSVLENELHIVCVGGEYYKCTAYDVEKAVVYLRDRRTSVSERIYDFKMRPEQEAAVKKTKEYFETLLEDSEFQHTTPKFLWNCKMRFGKTFTAYQLAKAMGFKRVLVLTFKPAVRSAWKDDLNTHVDFDGWQFLTNPSQKEVHLNSLDKQYENADLSNPIVCFGSLQDLLGVGSDGKIKTHNEWIHTTNWDLVIFDEYHFGAWREKAKDLFEKENEDTRIEREEKKLEDNGGRDIDSELDESFLPITTRYYLYLSGTPFRALNSGEFIEEQIFSWTYSNEQQAKENWDSSKGPNPYESLPRMVMMTYKLPESIRKIASQGEFNEFDLNSFFATEGNKANAQFIHKNYVQKWLDLIRGEYMETAIDDLKTNTKSPFPYSDIRLRQALQHTLWFLPNVNACHAMKNLLEEKQNKYYQDYQIVVCAGREAGVGADALKCVESAMEKPDPLSSKSITLSCGKLTTGVTVKPWTGVFMLRNLKQPETYFQTAFRAQSPWTIKVNGKTEIIKRECYVFDFAPNRTLRQLSEYACQLNVREHNPEKKVAEFIKFLPVLSYESNMMKRIDAAEILDIAMSGTSATLLARRWESALLVNVDNDTLARLLNNEAAMKALMSIEGFRNLNKDIATIINKSNDVKDGKRKGKDKNGTKREKDKLTEAEKEYKSKRKAIQEKLIKFATRIPIFMYLTDFREYCLRDVITELEPDLFKKVTGLQVKDFELLSSLGVFNEALMNDSIYKFRRYESASLEYTGINKHSDEDVGGFSTILKKDEFEDLYGSNESKIPVLKIGDKVQVENDGVCTVCTVREGSFSVKTSKGKIQRYIYPIAFELGTVKLVE